nr:hypothetical protein [uncultured Actinoplanes sp.]
MSSHRVGRVGQTAGAAGVAVLSALVWFAWLGRDHEYQVDPVTGAQSGPYETWQVVGCALSLLVVFVGALVAGIRPLPAPAALTVAFTAAWTVSASRSDTSGLYVVGTVLLLAGLSAATAAVAAVVSRLRRRAAH